MPANSPTMVSSVFRDIYNQNLYQAVTHKRNLIASTKDSLDNVQRMGLLHRLPVHLGCVNTVCWNRTGEYLLSGSDDQRMVITNPHNQKILFMYKTSHRANIFSARFMPQSGDHSIVSCSGDGIVLHTELLGPYIKRRPATSMGLDNTYEQSEKIANLNFFNCHKNGTTYEVLTVPSEPSSFMSCGEDGTVRFFDLRQTSSCHKTCCNDNILIFSPSAVTTMDLSPITNFHIAVGSSDSSVRIYDRRNLSVMDFSSGPLPSSEHHTKPVKVFAIPSTSKRPFRATSIKYSSDESQLLASFSSEYLYLFDLKRDGLDVSELYCKKDKGDGDSKSWGSLTGEQITRKLRLRGDWSDTGPDARPDRGPIGQVRPQLQSNIINRMTVVIARMLNDPRMRLRLSDQLNETNRDNLLSYARENNEDSTPSTSGAWRRAATRGVIQARQSRTIEMIDAADDSDTDDETPHSPPDSDEQPFAHFQEDESLLNKELAKLDMETRNKIYDYILMKFTGHRNARTMIKEATFWGSNYVMCGSDCGHIFTWDRRNGKLVMLVQGDQHVVNCLQPHPELPYLASSGIDYDIKIWAPILHSNDFNEEEANELVKRNAVMLEQTKDTITVPATFMIRMLACIHTLRTRERGQPAAGSDNDNGDDTSGLN